jgi:muconolactone delta-isomerase
VNTYIAELYHDPHCSPLANAASRKKAREVRAALPALMKRRKVKLIGDWHLDPEHRAILIFEAPSVEAVRDVIYEAGYMHYCDGRIYPATPLSEAAAKSAKLGTIF